MQLQRPASGPADKELKPIVGLYGITLRPFISFDTGSWGNDRTPILRSDMTLSSRREPNLLLK
jgi:hypothetical protein